MRVILKPLFDVLTGEVMVHDNIVYNYVILLLVGEFAFQIAFRIVGDLYRSGDISGSMIGSLLHWTFRLGAYVCVAYLLKATIWLYNWIKSIPIWVLWTTLGISVVVVVFGVVLEVIKNMKERR